MERIINCLEEVVARRGFEGIRLKDLWTEIEGRTSCKMGPALKNYLWRHMMACAKLSDESASKLSFFWTPENAQRKLPPLTEGLGARDPARVAVVAGELDKPREVCEAVKDGKCLFVVASERRRMRDIGLRDPNHGFTPMMYAVLEAVNSCGEMGISQVEVAARMGTDSKSVSHYARELIRNNFITKRQFVLCRDNGRRAAAVHLVMVKWDNMEGNFEVAEVENDEGGDNDDDEAATNVGRTIIYAELAMNVLQKLNAAKGQILIARDIAAYLSNLTGFRRGSWYSVRKRLLKAQYISIGQADKEDDSTLTFKCVGLMVIKLLRMPKSVQELELNFASSSTSVTYLPLYQEFPIEYQIYQHIQNAGSTGILQSDIRFPGLGNKLTTKRVERLLQSRKNVLGTQDSVGKIRTKRLKAAKEGRTAFEAQAASETIIVKHLPHRKWKSNALANLSSAADLKGVEKPETFGKHLSTLVNTKLIRRKQLILDTLEEKKVLPRIGTRYLINSLERTLGENCDYKTSKKLVEDIIAEGSAYLVTTTVTDERGVQKPVELVLHPSVKDASLWKPVVQAMSMDDLLCRYLQRRVGPKPYSDAERFPIDSIQLLDADGNMANPDGSIRLISEDEDSEEEVAGDEEDEVEFMDSDEEKAEISRREAAKASRLKARKEAAKQRAKKASNEEDVEMDTTSNTENSEVPENPNAAPSNKLDIRNYFQRLMWGLERAVLQRTNVLHAWLCYHHFGEEALGPLRTLLPNDIASVVNANNLQRQQETLHKQLVQGTGPNAAAPSSSQTPSGSKSTSNTNGSKAHGSGSGQETMTEDKSGNDGNDASSSLVSDPAIPNPSTLMSALFGKRPGHSTNSHEPTPKNYVHSTSSDTSYPARHRKNANNTHLLAATAEDAQISWEKATQRWFDGPEVHLESLLPEMPLYVFMKTIGIIEPPPGVPSPTQASNTLVKDLPQSAQAVLLARRNHQLPLHRLVECMKKLNLLQPKITFSDEDAPPKTGPVVPKYILNPIAIVWRNQIPADYQKGQATALPQKYFLYELDAKKSVNSDASVTNYWWRLKRESIAFLKEIVGTQESISHFNTPPPGRNFPKSPGLPDMCISSVSWSGRSEGLNNRILKANYDQMKLELNRSAMNTGNVAKPEGSPLLLTLSSQLDLSPNAIFRWLEQRTIQLERRERDVAEKKRKNISHDTSSEPARKKPLRRNNIEEDEEDTSAYTSRTITRPATNTIQIQVPLAVTPLGRAAAQPAPSSDPTQPRAGGIGAATASSEEPLTVPGKRWTQRQLAKLVDMFVMQKARAGIYLDDISTLYDGVDKDALSQAFNRRWEVLEGHLSESVSTVETLFDMSTRIAKAMRKLEEDGETIGVPPSTSTQAPTSENAMEVDVGPPTFVIELPASIEHFRAQNAIIYSNSSEYVVPRLSRRQMDAHTSGAGAEEVTEEPAATAEHHSPDSSTELSFSESTRKLFSVLPASEEHAIRLAESGFYHRGTGISTVAVCPSAPPSVWMLPNPRYAVLADHIKLWLMQDSMSEMLMPIVQRLLGDCPQKVYDEAFQALQQRRVVTASMTSGRRAHLTAQWSLWFRPVDAAIEFGNSAQTEKTRFADESVGYPAHPTLPTSDPVLFQPWILNFDIFSPSSTIATIINGMDSQSLYVDLQVTSITQKFRKTRRPIIVPTTLGMRRKEAQAKRNANSMDVTPDAADAGSTPSNKSTQNNPEVDDIDLQVRWWREPSIISRYTSSTMDALASQYHHAISEPAEMTLSEDPSYEKVIHLDCVGEQKETNDWNILVELLQLRGYDDEYIQLCQSTLDVIRAADAKAIELPQLEKALVEKSLIEGYSGLPIDGIASYEGHLTLIEILDTLVTHRLVFRVLGEMDEAWVATEFSHCWTVPLSASAAETSPSMEPKEAVVYFPWTQLDGLTDVLLLRKLRAHVAIMVIESPGISEELILDQFEVFRPSVGREMIKLLLTDDLVKESYKRFETPSFITASAESIATPTEVKMSCESEYHLYLRWKQRFILGEGPAPTFTVSRDFWPNKDIQLRL